MPSLHKSFLCTVFFISVLALASGCSPTAARKADDMSHYSYVPPSTTAIGSVAEPGIESF